jgi:hypothetical protein
VASGPYKAPVIFKDKQTKPTNVFVANWVEEKPGYYIARAGDKHAPRLTNYTFKDTKPKWDSPSAYKAAFRKAGLTSLSFQGPEKLDVSEQLLGSKSYIISGFAKRAGKKVRVFANIYHNPKTQNTTVFFYDAPLRQWEDWGGMAPAMVWLSLYEQSDFSPEALSELSKTKPAEDLKIFEEHFTGRMMSLFQGIMTTQSQTLSSMRSFNMSTANCAGIENCRVESDGVGGYETVID